MNKKKTILLGIVVLTIVMVSGMSFALWQITLKQSTTNVITTGCFRVELEEENPISLENAFPITDEEGKKLVPYTFTITNTCESYASYQINLEILDDTTLESFDYLKIMFEDNIDLLSKKETVSKTLENATTSKKLETGYLDIDESKTYHLRLWMSEDTPNDESFMNKIFQSKVTVTATYQKEFDRESPISNIEVTNLSNQIKVDASNSSDNTNIKYYYYSLDGENFVRTKEPEYTFEVGTLEYGVATETIKTLADSLSEEYTVYVKTEDEYGNLSEVVSKIILSDFAYDETTDNNLRYIGANPNNYVDIGDRDADGNIILWRLIGVMKNTENSNSEIKTRIKLTREETLGAFSWNSSGTNNWSNSSLQKELNGTYLDGISSNAKKVMDNMKWHLGGNSNLNDVSLTFYKKERGIDSSQSSISTWKGMIGLMYISDYGYATSGGDPVKMQICRNIGLFDWENSIFCSSNDWLHDSTMHQWTLTTFSASTSEIYHINSIGRIARNYVTKSELVFPSFYAKNSVKIIKGIGTRDNPFELSEK